MVVFQEKHPYFSRTMTAMNVMRKDVALCDIMLTVGQQKIHAHRCVLAAASPYFRSLFLGHFNEASMENIDLSSVTEEKEAVEMILDFIYTGEINITEDNLGAVIKLASFFLVEQLSGFCLEFMNNSLNLRNCLRYFFHSQDYGYQELCQRTLSVVESRFHDFIIFEESSLDISSVQLHFLLTNQVLQFCQAADLLEFVLKWLLKGATEEHLAVALDCIDYAGSKKSMARPNQRGNDLEDLYEKVATRHELLGTDSGKKVLKSFRKVMSKVSECCSSKVKTYNLRQQSPKLTCKQEGNSEMALVAFAPRQCVVEAAERQLAAQHSIPYVSYTEPVFDLCVYLVSHKTWYHVQQLTDEGFPGLMVNDCLGVAKCATMGNKLILINLYDEVIYFLDLQNMTWHEVSYHSQIEDDLDSYETIVFHNTRCVVGANQAVYLILRVNICVDESFDEVRQAYFRCYRMQEDDEWEFVFKTRVHSTGDHSGVMEAMISTVSNEMLILHSSLDNNCVYLADMSEEKPQPIPLLMTSETNECLFESAHLLEGKNQMCVVQATPQKVVLFEYKLKSKKLVPVSAAPAHTTTSGLSTDDTDSNFFDEDSPCQSKYSVSGGTSLWQIEGGRHKTSHLTELRVAQNKSLVQVKHTPPPFPYVTAVFAGQLDDDVISRLKPVGRYLSP